MITIKLRRGDKSKIESSEIIPSAGEPVVEVEENATRLKIGDGITSIKNLQYIGEDAIYTSTVPVTADHGGVSAGEVLAGMKVSDVLEKILTEYQDVNITSLSHDLSDYEVGYDATGTVNVSFTIANQANAVSGTLSSTEGLIATQAVNVSTVDPVPVNLTGYSSNIVSTAGITLAVTGSEGEEDIATTNAYWKGKIYYGHRSTKTLLTEAQIEGLVSSSLETSAIRTYNISAGYGYICIPDVIPLPTLDQFYDPDTNFKFDMSYLGSTTVNNTKIDLTYAVYSTSNYLNGTYNIDIR
ncbi:MAG: hypothetical protein ACXABY_04525 [Candidatus Thorarchaeota archaeon]|jgi:hypothetical protein